MLLDKEKFPKYFIVVIGIYVLMMLLVSGPFLTAMGWNLRADFVLLFAVVLLPLLLFVAYFHDDRIPALKGHEMLMRIIITAAAIAVSAFMAIFIIPIV